MLASQKGKLECVEMLLDRGADINMQKKVSRCPLPHSLSLNLEPIIEPNLEFIITQFRAQFRAQ